METSALMLRSTGLNTFGMINTIYRDLLCPANGGGRGNLSIEEVEHRGDEQKMLPTDKRI